jgi:hypothetical protein
MRLTDIDSVDGQPLAPSRHRPDGIVLVDTELKVARDPQPVYQQGD